MSNMLSNEELSKVTGGENVQRFDGYIVGDSHYVPYRNSDNGITYKIIEIETNNSQPFHVKMKYNNGIEIDTWYNKMQIDYIWSIKYYNLE